MKEVIVLQTKPRLYYYQGCSLGLDVSVSRRSRDAFSKRLGLGLGEMWERLGLGLVSDWKSNVSVSSRSRALGSRLQVTFFLYIGIERKQNDIFALKFSSIVTQFPFKVLESSI